MKKIINQAAFNQNCYIINIDNKTVIIDPGYSYREIKKYLGANKVDLILLTHFHFDHIGAVNDLCQEFNIKAYIHHKGYQLVQDQSFATKFGFPPTKVDAENLVTFQENISILPSLKIIHTPGHSQDSVLYLVDDQLFTGDTLFVSGPGRFDNLDSSASEMIKSLKKISNLSDRIWIYPGHGPSQSLENMKLKITTYIQKIKQMTMDK